MLQKKRLRPQSAAYSVSGVVLQEVRQVVAVPESALEFDGGKTYVYLKDGDSFERREIETGLSDGLNIEVKSGLKVGDVVRGNAIIAEE